MKDTGVKRLWNHSLGLGRALEVRCVAGECLCGGPERPLCEADCAVDPKMLEVPELLDTRQGELHTGSGSSLRERSVCFAVSKLEGEEPSKAFDISHRNTGFGV